jgi:hypothetical protein
MSRWKQKYENHAFHSHWKGLKSAFEKTELTIDASKEVRGEWARLKKMIVYVDDIFLVVDFDLINLSELDKATNFIKTITDQLYAFQSDPRVDVLVSANDNFDAILSYLQAYQFGAVSTLKSKQKAASSYLASLSDLSEQMQKALQDQLVRSRGQSVRCIKSLRKR